MTAAKPTDANEKASEKRQSTGCVDLVVVVVVVSLRMGAAAKSIVVEFVWGMGMERNVVRRASVGSIRCGGGAAASFTYLVRSLLCSFVGAVGVGGGGAAVDIDQSIRSISVKMNFNGECDDSPLKF